jgi:hypothetical protein
MLQTSAVFRVDLAAGDFQQRMPDFGANANSVSAFSVSFVRL